MRIGDLSAKAGVNVQTIRFYERQRLLPKPPRTPSGYRSYSDADLERVVSVRQSQQLGFTLKEIKQLLEVHEVLQSPKFNAHAKPREWKKALDIVRERLDLITRKIQFLRVLEKQLVAVLRQADLPEIASCPASPQFRKMRRARNFSTPRKKTS